MTPTTETTKFYSSHHDWLVAWLKYRLQCPYTAQDLAQETFLRVLERLQDLSAIQHPRPWLRTIAHGLLVDHVRRKDIEQAYLQALAVIAETYMPSAEIQASLLETLVAIDAMLDGLKPNVRKAFLLSRLEGMTYPEIATHLDVSLSSVEKYMATALRHCLRLHAID